MKKIFIGIFIIIIVAIFVWFLFHFQSQSIAPTSPPEATTNSNEFSPLYQIPPAATITLGTTHGSVTLNNYYKAALGAEDEFIVIAKNDSYEINYDTTDSGFYLDIKQAPFNANRVLAEASFLNLLGVSRIDACKLTVVEGAETAANSGLKGRSFSLSFCASSTFGE